MPDIDVSNEHSEDVAITASKIAHSTFKAWGMSWEYPDGRLYIPSVNQIRAEYDKLFLTLVEAEHMGMYTISRRRLEISRDLATGSIEFGIRIGSVHGMFEPDDSFKGPYTEGVQSD
jgi:hypothetical protein